MAFKVYTTQEVYINFRDTDVLDSSKKEIEKSILEQMRSEFSDIRITKSPTYWFNFTLSTKSDDGSITSVSRLKIAYDVLVRKATSVGLTEV